MKKYSLNVEVLLKVSKGWYIFIFCCYFLGLGIGFFVWILFYCIVINFIRSSYLWKNLFKFLCKCEKGYISILY